MRWWTVGAVMPAMGVWIAQPASAQRPNKNEIRKKLLEVCGGDWVLLPTSIPQPLLASSQAICCGYNVDLPVTEIPPCPPTR